MKKLNKEMHRSVKIRMQNKNNIRFFFFLTELDNL